MKRKWLFLAAVVVIVLAVIIAVADFLLTGWARKYIIATLSERFDSDVSFAKLDVSLFPRPRISGEGVILHHKRFSNLPPLIEINRFSADAGVIALLRSPRHLRSIHLEGLRIQVPPRRHNQDTSKRAKSKEGTPVVVDEIVSENAELVMLPKESGKLPLPFPIYHLRMESVALDRPAPFRATLTNPKPVGEIQTTGKFGPWQQDEPSQTAVSGNFAFNNADLATIHGLSGILSSRGTFAGVLERIEVEGYTDTPDFEVKVSGNPLALHTDYHAVVDGTNGNTYLEPVRARFLHSMVNAWGEVVKSAAADKGRTVSLDISAPQARAEDLLRLALRSPQPMLTGAVRFQAKFVLPPGSQDVMNRLQLDGQFGIASARFTNWNVQEKLDTLSKKGRGQPEVKEDPASIVANLRGHFTLRNGTVSFSNLTFSVPGALVELSGTYGLRTEALNFKGRCQLEAKLSQTTGGAKSFFLKLVDPFFHKRGAGAVLPIKITGTRANPSLGLNIG